MPNFSADGWESFRSQFMSIVRFVMYCFDMFFDTCRSNPMLYAFFFFPIFALAFFLIFEMLTHIAPFVSLINNKQVRGVLFSSKLSTKSYGKSLNSSSSLQNMASRKAAADAKSHAALISKVNSSGLSPRSLSSVGSSSYGDIKSSGEGKKISGKSGWDLNSIKHKNRRVKAKAFMKSEKDSTSDTFHKEKDIDKKVAEYDKAKAFRESLRE